MSRLPNASRLPIVSRPISFRARLGALLALTVALAAPAGLAHADDLGRFAGVAQVDTPIAGELAAPRVAPKPRIVGGGGAIAITDAPYQVQVLGPDGAYSCGGAILDLKTVITAAHCAKYATPGVSLANPGYSIVAGRTNAKTASPTTEQLRTVSSAITHPFYTPTGGLFTETTGDLALLTLSTPLTLTTSVRPIALPSSWAPTSTPAPVPGVLRVTGYGITTNGGTTDSQLRTLDTAPAPDASLCDSVADDAISICARSALGSSCQGDSGGPLVAPGAVPVLYGIVSNGAECGPNTDDYYVNLLAPENRVFIDSRGALTPPRAPRGVTDPSISGPASFRAGDTITCNAGTFANSPSEVRIEFTKDDGTVLQSTVGATAQLVLPAGAIGSHIGCRPFATNAGGTYVGHKFVTSNIVAEAPSCPLLKEYKFSALRVKVKAPKTARRGKTFKVKVTVHGLPSEAYTILLSTGGTGAKTKASLFDMAAGNDAVVGTMPVKLKSSAKLGRSYRLHVYVWQATNADELSAERACAVGYKAFSVRARR